jgi:hypothetical protein
MIEEYESEAKELNERIRRIQKAIEELAEDCYQKGYSDGLRAESDDI